MIRFFRGMSALFGKTGVTKASKRRTRGVRPSLDGLEGRELLTTLFVPATANIYGAGLAGPPGPGGGGGGVLPIAVNLSTLGNPRSVDFPSVTGSVSGWAAAGGYNGPDGGSNWGGVTNVRSWGGISGIQKFNGTMFLVGVYLGPTGQPAHAPATLNETNANTTTTFSPVLGQQFFIGDGHTATHALQIFKVPTGATRLYLGFAEVWGFGNPNLLPGYYNDNGGVLTVNVQGGISPGIAHATTTTTATTPIDNLAYGLTTGTSDPIVQIGSGVTTKPKVQNLLGQASR